MSTGGLFIISLIGLLVEIIFARFSRKSVGQTREFDESRQTQIIPYEFCLKLAFRDGDVLKEYVQEMKQHHMNLCARFQERMYEVGS